MLKYFATNRDLDKLGRAVCDSSDRHRLSRGGYYFVDMEKYMRFYLGTTDADEMPTGAVVGDSKKRFSIPLWMIQRLVLSSSAFMALT